MTDFPNPPLSTFLYMGNIPTTYIVLGEKTRPPLLLIPGFTGTHSDLLEIAHLLTSSYFVIIPDLPGWGKSARFSQKITIRHYAEYLHALLQELGIKKITLCGHCMGAVIALDMATVFPSLVTTLFLISTPYLRGTLNGKIFTFLANTSQKFPKPLRPLFFLWRNRFSGIPLDIFIIKARGITKKARLMWHHLVSQQQEHEDCVEEAWTSLMQYPYTHIGKIHVPIHLIHGRLDPLVSINQAKLFSSLLPHATFTIIKDSGHMPPLETPQEVADLILGSSKKMQDK